MPVAEEVKEIIGVLDASGIDRAVVFPFSSDYRLGNDRVIEGVSKSGGRLIGYAQLNLDSPAAMASELERCSARGMRGLKLHSSFGADFLNPGWEDVWDFCAENRWPVIIHGMLPSLAKDKPRTVFIQAHGIEAVFREEALEAMRFCGNYYWDTSSSMTLMGAVERAVSLFGSEKLLFGSDLPLNNPALRMGSVLAAKITERDMENILGGNIMRLLGLDPSSIAK